ncbi:MAG: hypothetical protein MJE68_31060 [Proteobacteria bacterium]|nr:hypothetical protein [Pseudomonadota bacterium]
MGEPLSQRSIGTQEVGEEFIIADQTITAAAQLYNINMTQHALSLRPRHNNYSIIIVWSQAIDH